MTTPLSGSGAIVSFGEIIWDCLPTGRFLGGAPLNVAYHLSRLGLEPRLVSAVGADRLGDEALQLVGAMGLKTDLVSRRPRLPTGIATASLDSEGRATFQIDEPSAWDRLGGPPPDFRRGPLVFGTLALRKPWNRRVLRSWIAAGAGPTICDINLRPPFDALGSVREFLTGLDLLKLNADEAGRLAPSCADRPGEAAVWLASEFRCGAVCITLGGEGAVLAAGGRLLRGWAPPIQVRDTIGAGDAFTAALVASLAAPAPLDWQAALNRACALGAFVSSRAGAQPPYTPSEVPGL